MRKVAITGMGVISALGAGAGATAAALASGASRISPLSCFDASHMPCSMGGEAAGFIVPPGSSRGFALLDEAAGQAISSAGLQRGFDAAIVLGTTLGGMEKGTAFMRSLKANGFEAADPAVLEDFLPACQPVSLARKHKVKGRTVLVNNACSSGTDAIGLAFEMIGGGEIDRAIAGGYEPLCEFIVRGFSSLQIITRTKCRPFDRDRDGMILGEGAAVFVLESERAAKARGAEPLGFVAGFGASSDSHHMTQPDPEGSGVSRAVKNALGSAGLEPSDIGYINLPGTGTKLNDQAEYRGLRAAFGEALRSIPCSSTKGATGHALGAAGAIEAAFCLLAQRGGFVPACAGFENRDPDMPDLRIISETGRLTIRYALSDSIGFGGGSSALILESAPGATRPLP